MGPICLSAVAPPAVPRFDMMMVPEAANMPPTPWQTAESGALNAAVDR